MYEPKSAPFFELLKADVLERAASLDRGEGIPAAEVYTKARALIDKIEKERDDEKPPPSVARVIYPPEAEDDLLLAPISPAIIRFARAFIARVEKRVDALSIFPNRGRRRPESDPEFRSIPVGPVVVFYRVSDKGATVAIARIIDGRRDLTTLFLMYLFEVRGAILANRMRPMRPTKLKQLLKP